MFTGVLFWITAAAALPLSGGVVCEIEGRSSSDDGRNVYTIIRRLLVERQDSSSSGPQLGVILGAVFGALGGLAIAGILFYAWWSVRHLRSKQETPESGGGSSSGPSSSTSGTSRTSSSKTKKKRPKDAPKWQDPWLAPAPKSPRAPTAIQFRAPAPVDVSKQLGIPDDQGSDSSAIPLTEIYPSDDKH